MKKSITQLVCSLALMLTTSLSFGQVSFTNMADTIYDASGGPQVECVVDMNGDQIDDIVRVQGSDMRINYQQADGTFSETFFDLNLQNSSEWSIAAGDLNNDGFNDIVMGGGNAVSFVLAVNGGTDYVEQAIPDYIFSQRSTIADIDNDGDLDAFVCHDVDLSHPYRNDGTGFMVEDQSIIATVNAPGNYSAIWVDYDNDGDDDMYLTKCKLGSVSGDPDRTNAMYRNNGNGTFSEVADECNLADNSQSWSTVFEDFDNDGDFDAFIINHDFQNRFMENNGDGTFTDIIQTTGIDADDLGAWEVAGGDFNNDGYVDILSQLTSELYLNNGDMTFTGTDLTFRDGGIGDLNNDGFLDVVSGSTVMINDGNDNNWIKFSLQGIVSNQSGIGARVEIYGDWGIQIREVRSGQSFSPMSSLNTYFGIGTATSIEQVVVKWPSGIITTIDNPSINEGHHLVEADCLLPITEIDVVGNTMLCPGESVTLSAPDGFDTYSWSNGMDTQEIEISDAGTYRIVLFDEAGCASLSNNIVIGIANDLPPVIEFSGEQTFCEGGTLNLTINENSPNPTWSSGQTGTSIDVAASGTYSVSIDALCSTNQLVSESVEIDVISSQAPEVTSAELNDDNSVTLEVSGNNITWYDEPIGGNVLGTGNIFNSLALEEITSFYAEDANGIFGALQSGGKELSGEGGLPSTGGYSFFNAFEPFTLLTVDVLVPDEANAGVRQIQLFNSADEMIDQREFNLEQGLHTLELNFELPVGEQFYMICPQNNLFRNDQGVSYPYSIGDVGEITSSNFGGNWYYYFYNWQIQKESTLCLSARTEVTMTPVAVNEIESINQLDVYPNPATTDVTLAFNSTLNETITVGVYNVIGKLATTKIAQELTIGLNLINLNVSDLPSGIYNVELQLNGQKTTRKIVVE